MPSTLVPEYSFQTRNQVKTQMDSGPGPESAVSWDLEDTWAWKREPVKTATLQKGHNQKGHTEWGHYQNGHTVLVQRATLLWSKRPQGQGHYQNGDTIFGQNGHRKGLIQMPPEGATKTATGIIVITPHLSVSSRVLGCEENWYFERWNSHTHPPI